MSIENLEKKTSHDITDAIPIERQLTTADAQRQPTGETPVSRFAAQDQRVADIFRDKPELVSCFPEWMLSPGYIASIKGMKNPAIVEIAGRDSVAAAVKSVAENAFTDLIPVYAYTGTEYGPWIHTPRAVERLAACLPQVRVHELIMAGAPKFWRALNARFIGEWVSWFGYYSPCPGCHLYLHAIRFPLAKKLGGLPIISGERESHGKTIKINQTGPALDIYQEMAGHFDIRLFFPLRHVTRDEDIETLLNLPWARDEDQLKCAFSGNYRRLDNTVGPAPADVRRYFREFALPTAISVVNVYMNGGSPDAEEIARQVLKNPPTDP